MYKTCSVQLRNLSSEHYQMLRKFCWHSARFYNSVIYAQKQNYKLNKKNLSKKELYHLLKPNNNYKFLTKSLVAEIIDQVDTAYKSFFTLSKKDKTARTPKFLKKNAYNKLVFCGKGGFYSCKDKKLKLYFGDKHPEFKISLPDFVKNPKSFEIIPGQGGKFFTLFITYEENTKQQVSKNNNYLSIDLGVKNLATCYDSNRNKAFIVNGKKLLNINYFYHKSIARLKSENERCKGKKKYTSRMYRVTNKRNNQVKDYIQKVSKYIISYCLDNNISNLIVGHNTSWKQNVDLGKRNNQNFVSIPHSYFIANLKYRCEEYGISFQEVQESYTSKCSAIDNESIGYHDKYLGKRVYRGLFETNQGILINADVNGAINILRNVTAKDYFNSPEHIKGIVAYPDKVSEKIFC